jgi:hypothetical protein
MSTPQDHVANAGSDGESAGRAADEDRPACCAEYMVREQTGQELLG